MQTPHWVVKGARAKADYTLELIFADGARRVYDARPLLAKPIYAQLRSLPFFLQARAECGTVVWSDEIDIAPEHLYECSVSI